MTSTKRSTISTAAVSSPIVLNTWAFVNATRNAFTKLMTSGATCLDAVEVGCRTCEDEQCDGSVGWGNHPAEDGETTLDAMIMDGRTMAVGAVAKYIYIFVVLFDFYMSNICSSLHRVKNPVRVARAVLRYSEHSLIVGESATKFALEMGFKEEDLHSNTSISIWNRWKANNCQPNFRRNVKPDPTTSCGPYTPNVNKKQTTSHRQKLPPGEHDTIGMIALDSAGNMAVATSTNGLQYKVPGRVADSPLVGSGAYVDNEVGGAVATGDGDVMQRFVPSYNAVQLMRQGAAPDEACLDGIKRIARFYPNFTGAVVALDRNGRYGAACHGMDAFPFSVMQEGWAEPKVIEIGCLKS